MSTNQKPIDAATLVGLACHLGTVRALEFAEYYATIGELDEPQRKLLLRGWLGIQHLPGDATLEASDMQRCLVALRQAWLQIKHGS